MASYDDMGGKFVATGNPRGVHIPETLFAEAGPIHEADLPVDCGKLDGISACRGELRISPVELATGATLLQLSEGALSDWNRPEEDAACAHLQ